GDNFQPYTIDVAVQMATDHYVVRPQRALETAGRADRHVAGGFDRALDNTIDVERGVEDQFSSELSSTCDNRRPARLNLSFTTFANESHFTRPSFSNRLSYSLSVHCMNGSGFKRRWI